MELESINQRVYDLALKVIEPKTYATGERKSSRTRFHPEPMPITATLPKKYSKSYKKKKSLTTKEEGFSQKSNFVVPV
jgi:hypothetical protein